MNFIVSNLNIIIAILLIVSEAASAIAQVLFPDNQGFTGIIAAVIKVLQSLKMSEPDKK